MKRKPKIILTIFNNDFSASQFLDMNDQRSKTCVPQEGDIFYLTTKDFFIYEKLIPKSLKKKSLIKSLVNKILIDSFPRDINLISYKYYINSGSENNQIIVVAVYKEIIQYLQKFVNTVIITVTPILIQDVYKPEIGKYIVTFNSSVEECTFINKVLCRYSNESIEEERSLFAEQNTNRQDNSKNFTLIAKYSDRVDNITSSIQTIKLLPHMLCKKKNTLSYLVFTPRPFRMGLLIAQIIIFSFILIFLLINYKNLSPTKNEYDLLKNKYINNNQELISKIIETNNAQAELDRFNNKNVQKLKNLLQILGTNKDMNITIDSLNVENSRIELVVTSENAWSLLESIKAAKIFTRVELLEIVKQGNTDRSSIRGYINE